MKLNYRIDSGKPIEEEEKPLTLNTKVDMQTRLMKALQSKQGQQGNAPMMEMPTSVDGFGRTN